MPVPQITSALFRRAATAVLVVYWVTLVTATHWPLGFPPQAKPLLSKDKLLHFSAYAGLGFLLYLNVRLRADARAAAKSEWPPGRSASRGGFSLLALLLVVVATSLAGLADEFTQPLFDRDFEWNDWLADSVGAVCGVILSAMSWRLLAGAKQRPQPRAIGD